MSHTLVPISWLAYSNAALLLLVVCLIGLAIRLSSNLKRAREAEAIARNGVSFQTKRDVGLRDGDLAWRGR